MSSVDSICGWELNNPDPELFESTEEEKTEEHMPSDKCPGTCWNCPFLMKCLWPPKRRCLIPKDCHVHELGCEKSEGGKQITYFASKKSDGIVFFRLVEPVCEWADIRRIDEKDLPDWAVSKIED